MPRDPKCIFEDLPEEMSPLQLYLWCRRICVSASKHDQLLLRETSSLPQERDNESFDETFYAKNSREK
jgi:hypothetical protein